MYSTRIRSSLDIELVCAIKKVETSLLSFQIRETRKFSGLSNAKAHPIVLVMSLKESRSLERGAGQKSRFWVQRGSLKHPC
jgi:hypothetical protein